jgi:uncharacterized membrane protein
VLEEAKRRNSAIELRVADRITAFAGSMNFVWIHAALFAVWMLFLEQSPWPTLTLVVSLEAIFLSTFVMIGQNRQAAFQQAKADHDFEAQELELKTNTDLTRQIHILTVELHRRLIDGSGSGPRYYGMGRPVLSLARSTCRPLRAARAAGRCRCHANTHM